MQPGGGNTSIKLKLPAEGGGEVDALLVKGAGPISAPSGATVSPAFPFPGSPRWVRRRR